jgi:hypothetical protein
LHGPPETDQNAVTVDISATIALEKRTGQAASHDEIKGVIFMVQRREFRSVTSLFFAVFGMRNS